VRSCALRESRSCSALSDDFREVGQSAHVRSNPSSRDDSANVFSLSFFVRGTTDRVVVEHVVYDASSCSAYRRRRYSQLKSCPLHCAPSGAQPYMQTDSPRLERVGSAERRSDGPSSTSASCSSSKAHLGWHTPESEVERACSSVPLGWGYFPTAPDWGHSGT
jgi:hypothetical protein